MPKPDNGNHGQKINPAFILRYFSRDEYYWVRNRSWGREDGKLGKGGDFLFHRTLSTKNVLVKFVKCKYVL